MKQYKGQLEISAMRKNKRETGIEFFSYDKKTASLVFNLNNKTNEQILFGTENVMIVIENNGKKVFNMNIDDETKGLVSFIIPEELLIREGNFLCGLYIDYGLGKTLDVGYFNFSVKKSLIDEDIPEMQQYYVESFESLKENIIAKDAEIQASIVAMDNLIVDKSASLTVLETEYADKALVLEETYAPRLTEVSSQLAHKANESDIDIKIKAMSTGTPKIIVQSIAELPKVGGVEKLALVLDDGKKYYDDGLKWQDGGLYQTTGFNDTEGNYIATDVSGALKEVADNSFFISKNIVKNSDFSLDTNADGIADDWIKGGTNVSVPTVSNNKQRWIPLSAGVNSAGVSTNMENDIMINHTYYVGFEQKNILRTYLGAGQSLIYGEPDGKVSALVKSTIGNTKTLYFYPKQANVESYLSNVLVVDLSETFGIGNEPELEEFEKILKKINAEWFKKSVNLLEIKKTKIFSAKDLSIFKKEGFESSNVQDALNELSTRKIDGNSILEKTIDAYKTDFLKPTKNIFNALSKDRIDGYYNHRNGVLNSNPSYFSILTKFEAGKTYKTNLPTTYEIAFFDSYFTFKSGIQAGWVDLVVPNDTTIMYGYITFKKDTANLDNIMIVENLLPESFVPYGFELDDTILIKKTTSQPIEDVAVDNMLIFGDSITENAYINEDGTNYTPRISPSWVNQTEKDINAKRVRNYAKSGASFKDQSVVGSIRNSMSGQINMAIQNLEKPSLVVVSCGTNDGSGSLGTYATAMSKTSLEDLDRSLTYEALRWSFWTIRKEFPNAVCFATTPIQRVAYEPPQGLINAIVEMAKRYNFIIIDALNESGIVRDFEVSGANGRYLIDGLHPNDDGKKVLSTLYSRTILKNILLG